MNIKLRKLIGKYIGYYCEVCGEPLEEYGYNFHTACFNKDCPLNRGAIGRFGA